MASQTRAKAAQPHFMWPTSPHMRCNPAFFSTHTMQTNDNTLVMAMMAQVLNLFVRSTGPTFVV